MSDAVAICLIIMMYGVGSFFSVRAEAKREKRAVLVAKVVQLDRWYNETYGDDYKGWFR